MLILRALSPCSSQYTSRTSARVSESRRGCSKHWANQVWSSSSLTAVFWQKKKKIISLKKKKSPKPFLTNPADNCLIFCTFWAEISNAALCPTEMLQRQFKEKWYFQYNDNKIKCVSTYFPNSCKKLRFFFFSEKLWSNTGYWKLLFWDIKTWHGMSLTGEDLNQ